MALKCLQCNTYFCGYCRTIYPNSLDAHNGVPDCGPLGTDAARFRRHRLAQCQLKIDIYLEDFPADVVAAVRETLA